jgi:ABC-type uncharacterized transport system substrate-binding protein
MGSRIGHHGIANHRNRSRKRSGFRWLCCQFPASEGNITGLFLDQPPERTGKWLQLIREVAPNARRIAVLWDANTGEDQIRAISKAAKAMSIDLQVLKFREASPSVSQYHLAVTPVEKPDIQVLLQLRHPDG